MMKGLLTDYRVILIDMDGTLVRTASGARFPKTEHDWMPIMGMYEALKKNKPDFIHIVTNQANIVRGIVNEERWNWKAEYIRKCLEAYTGAKVTYDYCPDNDKTNPDRKPNPGMFHSYVDLYKKMTGHDLNPGDCLMIGDASGKPGQFSDSDKKFAENCGIDYIDAADYIKQQI